jgi:phospholipase A-2-activating protein
MSQINRTELPGVEALANHGKRDGQTIMINNENEIEVYSWSEVEMRWVKIGVAVGSSTAAGGSNREKVLFEGKEYDFVFDISLDDEGTSLKLPYNLSEDPWFTAQAFIHKHELSQIFLDQIAQFIITNTKGQTIISQNTSYVDPFTGEGRYTPGNSEIAASGGSHFDPFTGEGRYTPFASSIEVVPKNDSFNDPFTGGNAYRSANQKETTKSNEYYPQPGFVLFDQKNIPPISKKIQEFQAINNSDSSQIDAILNIAESENNDLSREFHALLTLLTSWSEGIIITLIIVIF